MNSDAMNENDKRNQKINHTFTFDRKKKKEKKNAFNMTQKEKKEQRKQYYSCFSLNRSVICIHLHFLA